MDFMGWAHRLILEDAMSNSPMLPNAIGSLVVDAEVKRLMIRTTQTERLMECALRRGDYTRAAYYYRLCGAACATCLDLLTD